MAAAVTATALTQEAPVLELACVERLSARSLALASPFGLLALGLLALLCAPLLALARSRLAVAPLCLPRALDRRLAPFGAPYRRCTYGC